MERIGLLISIYPAPVSSRAGRRFAPIGSIEIGVETLEREARKENNKEAQVGADLGRKVRCVMLRHTYAIL